MYVTQRACSASSLFKGHHRGMSPPSPFPFMYLDRRKIHTSFRHGVARILQTESVLICLRFASLKYISPGIWLVYSLRSPQNLNYISFCYDFLFLFSVLTTHSVFNAGCKALLGTISAEQFEREIMRQNPAGPHPNPHDGDDPQLENEPEEYVFVDELFVDEPAGSDGAPGDENESDIGEYAGVGGERGQEGEEKEEEKAVDVDGGGSGGGGTGRRVSGKRLRRGFEQRRERQQERRLALEAVAQDHWDEFWSGLTMGMSRSSYWSTFCSDSKWATLPFLRIVKLWTVSQWTRVFFLSEWNG